MRFGLEELKPASATFRNGDRYIAFELHGDELAVRIGIGSNHWEEASFNSIRLDTLVNFMFGRLPRGCHKISDCSLQDCVGKAMKDLKEFTYEFLCGDFRPFLRTLAMYNREKKEAAKVAQDLSSRIYLA